MYNNNYIVTIILLTLMADIVDPDHSLDGWSIGRTATKPVTWGVSGLLNYFTGQIFCEYVGVFEITLKYM